MEWLLKEGKSAMTKPLLTKIGVALALTFAGYFSSHLRIKRIRTHPQPPSVTIDAREGLKELQTSVESGNEETPKKETRSVGFSPSSKNSGDDEGYLLPEFNELVQKELEVTRDSPKTRDLEVHLHRIRRGGEAIEEMEQEIINLRNMVEVLKDRERNLEIQLLELYGLREQETAVRELQNRLKINTMEAKLFVLKIESLQADNRRLQSQVVDYSKLVSDLESARAKIKLLKRKMRLDSEQTREQLSGLQQRVAGLQEHEYWAARDDSDMEKKLQSLKDLEDELVELKRSNSRLQRENLDLAKKLESTQILASSVLEGPQAKVLDEANRLRQENEELTKDLDRLRTDRCADAEELVYLKWINACLRYELRNYQPPPGKTVARDLSKSLSPKSEEKAKQLILEYSNLGRDENSIGLIDFDSEYCSSSQTSNHTEMGEFDDPSVDRSTIARNNSSSKKFFGKLKKLVLGKDSRNSNNNQNRSPSLDRTSTSSTTSGRRPSLSICSMDETPTTYSYDSILSCTTVDHPQVSSLNASAPLTPKRTEVKTTDVQNGISLSNSTSRSSLDLQSLRKLHRENVRDVEDIKQRRSDVGSSYGYRRMILEEGCGMDFRGDHRLDQDHDAAENSELLKFAHALKSSRPSLKLKMRTSSFTSY